MHAPTMHGPTTPAPFPAPAHEHVTGAAGDLLAAGADLLVGAVLVLALLGRAVAVARVRGHGRPWSGWREAAWLGGAAAIAAGLVGPLAVASHREPVAHMAAHLLLGMIAPLLLVVSAPMTLALRALPRPAARRLSRVLKSPPLRLLTHPVVAAVVNVGGLWLLYRTPLYALMQHDVAVHLAVSVHLLVAGYLFTASVVPVDPTPHRAGYPVRVVALLLALTAHGILAKLLYAEPPAGGPAVEWEAAALLMYYGGDVVDAALAVGLCAQWYRETGRSLARPRGALRPG